MKAQWVSFTREPATVKAPAMIIKPGADCLGGEGEGGEDGVG